MSATQVIIAIGVLTGLFIGLLLHVLNNRSWFALRRAQRKFQPLLLQHGARARVCSYGGSWTSVRYPDIWIVTVTDEERNRLQRDSKLVTEFRQVLGNEGYVDETHVQFVFESEETINREFRGSLGRRRYAWYRANDYF